MNRILLGLLGLTLIASVAFAVRTETELINFTGGITENGSNITAASSTTFSPYPIPFATSNNISLANGNCQYYAPTNTSTIYLPAVLTNQIYFLRIDLNVGTNSFTIATNGFARVFLSTNPVFSLSTNCTTPVIFDKPYNATNWNAWTLKP